MVSRQSFIYALANFFTRQQIIVIGCGLAGLTVAIALTKGGHKVEMLESAAEITYIGAGRPTFMNLCLTPPHSHFAGIQVSPNSSRILRKLGVDKFIEKYVTEPVDLKMMRWQDGKVLVECPLKEPAQKEYGSPYWCVTRIICLCGPT
jgi:salicylate hydroxylase